jgi:hypothetical protein
MPMQCPSCEHEATEAEFGQPAKCPACGVYYHKALANKQRIERKAREPECEPDPEISEPSLGAKLKRGVDGAIRAVEEGRGERLQQQAAARALLSKGQAAPVAVVDLQMPFSSMVWFMVKWVIASIPALIILMLIGWMAAGFILGLTGALSGPPKL